MAHGSRNPAIPAVLITLPTSAFEKWKALSRVSARSALLRCRTLQCGKSRACRFTRGPLMHVLSVRIGMSAIVFGGPRPPTVTKLLNVLHCERSNPVFIFILDTCEYVSWPMLRLNFSGGDNEATRFHQGNGSWLRNGVSAGCARATIGNASHWLSQLYLAGRTSDAAGSIPPRPGTGWFRQREECSDRISVCEWLL